MALQNRIEECITYKELYEEFADYIYSLDCDGIYIATDKELVKASLNGEFPKDEYVPDNMMLAYAGEKGRGNLDVKTLALQLFFQSPFPF